jgi:hypothetical protein
MDELKRNIGHYREVDDKLRILNKEVYKLRDKKNQFEAEIVEILKDPKFVHFDKIEISGDGSKLLIKRPTQWTKPWSLSKKDLQDLLLDFFGSDATKAAECYMFILQKHSETLRSNDFSIERVLPKTD